MKSVKKIKSVASALSVIDFEHLWLSRSEEHVNSVCVGTVFQTAAFFLFLIPRLRPGTINMTRMAVWKTVPYKLFRLRLLRHVQNLSRITRMRRVCSFTDFIFFLVLPIDIGFTTDCFCAYTALDSLQQEIIRDNHSARQGADKS